MGEWSGRGFTPLQENSSPSSRHGGSRMWEKKAINEKGYGESVLKGDSGFSYNKKVKDGRKDLLMTD